MCLPSSLPRALHPMGGIEQKLTPKPVRDLQDKHGPEALLKRMKGSPTAGASMLTAPAMTEPFEAP
jgi:hypothetical protein